MSDIQELKTEEVKNSVRLYTTKSRYVKKDGTVKEYTGTSKYVAKGEKPGRKKLEFKKKLKTHFAKLTEEQCKEICEKYELN